MVRRTEYDALSTATIRRRLAEKNLKPWHKKMWCIPKIDAEFVARMKDVLNRYTEHRNEKRPVVCFDDTPRQPVEKTCARACWRCARAQLAAKVGVVVAGTSAGTRVAACVAATWRRE